MYYKVISSHIMPAQVILSVTIQDPIIWNENNKVTWPPALILLLISVLILRKEICCMSYLICTKCSGASPEPSLGTTVHDFNNMLCKWFINWKGSQYHQLFSWLYLPHLTWLFFIFIASIFHASISKEGSDFLNQWVVVLVLPHWNAYMNHHPSHTFCISYLFLFLKIIFFVFFSSILQIQF